MAEQRRAVSPRLSRYSMHERDEYEERKGTPIPKRRPPGHFGGRIDGVYTDGAFF